MGSSAPVPSVTALIVMLRSVETSKLPSGDQDQLGAAVEELGRAATSGVLRGRGLSSTNNFLLRFRRDAPPPGWTPKSYDAALVALVDCETAMPREGADGTASRSVDSVAILADYLASLNPVGLNSADEDQLWSAFEEASSARTSGVPEGGLPCCENFMARWTAERPPAGSSGRSFTTASTALELIRGELRAARRGREPRSFQVAVAGEGPALPPASLVPSAVTRAFGDLDRRHGELVRALGFETCPKDGDPLVEHGSLVLGATAMKRIADAAGDLVDAGSDPEASADAAARLRAAVVLLRGVRGAR